MTRVTAFACAAVLSCGFRLQAEGAGPSSITRAPAQQPPSFRGGTVLVEVDAIVTDSSGRFVSGLTADDFEILEDGTRQRIDRLYTVSGATVIPSVPSREEAAATSSPPGAAPPRMFVLLFDQEHMQPGSFKRLQQAAVAFLTNQFEPGDVGGVVIGGTMAGNHLTSNRDELVDAVKRAKPDFSSRFRQVALTEWPRFASEVEAIRIGLFNDSTVLGQVVRRACADDEKSCPGADSQVMAKAREIVGELRVAGRRTVTALQALASGLGRLPGRKTIVLMTDGFFIEESWADLRQIVGAAARSNVRFYSIDTRGIDTRQAADIHQLSVMDPDGGPPLEAYNTIEDGPNMLAVDTGGYVIRHTNDFAGALSEISRDTSQYYVIGYVPTNPAADGSFRKISVRVTRSGLKVRARRGYLAAPGMLKPGAREPEHGSPGPPGTAEPVPAIPTSAGVPEELLSPGNGSAAPFSARSASRPAEPPGFVLRPDSSDRINELAARDGSRGMDDSPASRGWDRYRAGDLEGAAELLEKAAAVPGAHAWIHYALGYSQLGLGHIDRAAQEWEQVRTLAPEFRPVYLDLADAYVQLRNYGRAIDVLKAAESRWTGDVDVMNALGTIQVRRGALDDAIRTFEAAIAANRQDALAYFNLARTHELRYFKLRRYSRIEGRWLADKKDVKTAITNYEQYVRLGGPYVEQAKQALQNLAWLQ